MRYDDVLQPEQVEGYLARLGLAAPLSTDLDGLNPLNFYVSQHPDIHFRHVIHLNLRNPDGSLYSLDGTEFKIRTEKDTTVIPVETIDQLKTILETYYGMDPATAPLRDSL